MSVILTARCLKQEHLNYETDLPQMGPGPPWWLWLNPALPTLPARKPLAVPKIADFLQPEAVSYTCNCGKCYDKLGTLQCNSKYTWPEKNKKLEEIRWNKKLSMKLLLIGRKYPYNNLALALKPRNKRDVCLWRHLFSWCSLNFWNIQLLLHKSSYCSLIQFICVGDKAIVTYHFL